MAVPESPIASADPHVEPRRVATLEPASLLSTEEDEIAQLPWMIRLTLACLVTTALGWLLSNERLGLPVAVSWALYAAAYVTGGFFSIQGAWETLKQRQFDVNFLMIIAAVGAALVGQPREGAILMFLFSLSNTLETYAMGRTHASVRALLDMAPKEADVYRDGQIIRVPVESLDVGEIVLVRPGAQIPADGVVVKGESAVNEASITGESMPVEKRVSLRVFAGTLNGQGALDVRVTTAVSDSTLARIVAVVREAREQKAASQDFTDRVRPVLCLRRRRYHAGRYRSAIALPRLGSLDDALPRDDADGCRFTLRARYLYSRRAAIGTGERGARRCSV
jgi:Zn2+/Cd2+-exporting ATPase